MSSTTRSEDFTQGAERYDLIIDNVGTHSMSEYRRVLNPNGALVMVGGPNDGVWLGPLAGSLKALLVSPFISQRFMFFLAKMNQRGSGCTARADAGGEDHSRHRPALRAG